MRNKPLFPSNLALRSIRQLRSYNQKRIRLVNLASRIWRRKRTIEHVLLLVLGHACRFLEMGAVLHVSVSVHSFSERGLDLLHCC